MVRKPAENFSCPFKKIFSLFGRKPHSGRLLSMKGDENDAAGGFKRKYFPDQESYERQFKGLWGAGPAGKGVSVPHRFHLHPAGMRCSGRSAGKRIKSLPQYKILAGAPGFSKLDHPYLYQHRDRHLQKEKAVGGTGHHQRTALRNRAFARRKSGAAYGDRASAGKVPGDRQAEIPGLYRSK